jgi:6-phosphofructokinase 1
MHLSDASPCAEVDLCLIPEVPIVLEGQTSIFGHLERVIARQGHAVVVVAEGAGEELLAADKLAKGEKIEVSGK